MDMREMVDKVKKGEPLYGKTTLSPYMQGVASRNSRYAGVWFHVLPWFNFVNHNQVNSNVHVNQGILSLLLLARCWHCQILPASWKGAWIWANRDCMKFCSRASTSMDSRVTRLTKIYVNISQFSDGFRPDHDPRYWRHLFCELDFRLSPKR